MIIYGAGGHAKVIYSILADCGEKISMVFDDDPSKKSFLGIECESYNSGLLINEKIIISIGDNVARRALSERITHEFGNVIHPSALLDSSIRLGIGLAMMHRAVIQVGCYIGNHTIINTGAIIEHECLVGDFAHIAPGAILCGNVHIGENSLIGAGSVILPNLKIGTDCIVGAGSVITKNIPDGATVWGNPGRIIKL
jgi:sugar O-acyltransferase (sialic acid O-acetyltransferase NeuD family)